MRAWVLAAGLLVSGAANAQMMNRSSDIDTESSNYQMCSSWNYNSDAGGYVCGFTSFVDLVDRYDLYQYDQAIRDLQQQVNDLEQRVRALESRQ